MRVLMGPVGSGKTTALIVELLRRARMQAPGPDGLRHSRILVVRNTEPQLQTTTLPTFFEVVPKEYCKVNYDSPITVRFQPEGIDAEFIFLAMDNPQDSRKVLSLALTFAAVNEGRELDRSNWDLITSRVGRYPAARDGGCTWGGVIMDTNPPDMEHWLYQLAEVERPKGWEFFKQPGGLSPGAENLHNLNQSTETARLPPDDPVRRAKGREYYERLVAGKTDDWIKVYVHGQYGFSNDGKPVFPEYSDAFHTAAEPLEPLASTQVVVGLDPGLGGSAAVFLQKDARGRWLAVHELVGEDLGVEAFGRLLSLELPEAFPDAVDIQVWVDPASKQRSQIDTRTVLDVLKRTGLPVRTAATNELLPRLEAVRRVLTRVIAGKPGFIVCPNCTKLRKALTAYHYRRLRVSGGEKFHDLPEKDEHSHIVDALGYALLGAGELRMPPRPGVSRPPYCLT